MCLPSSGPTPNLVLEGQRRDLVLSNYLASFSHILHKNPSCHQLTTGGESLAPRLTGCFMVTVLGGLYKDDSREDAE